MKKEITDNQTKELIAKAEAYCAKDEQCCSGVRKKLYDWGADSEQAHKVIDYLVAHNFISEQRYADAYAIGNLHSHRWGRIKITYQLRQKQIPDSIIKKAIAQLPEEDYRQALATAAEQKMRQLDGDDKTRRGKLTTHLLSHGFEMSEIQEYYNNINLSDDD